MSDLISKSSLIYKLQHWREKLIQEYGENDEYVRCLDGVLDVYISDAPTVDAVEVVHGEWNEVYEEDEKPFFRKKYYCSNCGDWNTYGETNYCPNCGAKMDEVSE